MFVVYFLTWESSRLVICRYYYDICYVLSSRDTFPPCPKLMGKRFPPWVFLTLSKYFDMFYDILEGLGHMHINQILLFMWDILDYSNLHHLAPWDDGRVLFVITVNISTSSISLIMVWSIHFGHQSKTHYLDQWIREWTN